MEPCKPNRIEGGRFRFGLSRLAVGAMWTSLLLSSSSEATVLYDASLGGSPAAQGWALGFFPFSPIQAVGGGLLSFDSSSTIQAGFARNDQSLDAAGGYRLGIDLRIDSESHGTNDRAGFSLIVVSSDPTRALELGFWEDEIWAQTDAPLFTHGEGASFDTTLGVVHYDLVVHATGYDLLAGGASLLSGSLRDYTPFGGFPDPYETPNFLFFGDDTSSASAAFSLARIELLAVPEPGSMLLLGLGLLALGARRSGRRGLLP